MRVTPLGLPTSDSPVNHVPRLQASVSLSSTLDLDRCGLPHHLLQKQGKTQREHGIQMSPVPSEAQTKHLRTEDN